MFFFVSAKTHVGRPRGSGGRFDYFGGHKWATSTPLVYAKLTLSRCWVMKKCRWNERQLWTTISMNACEINMCLNNKKFLWQINKKWPKKEEFNYYKSLTNEYQVVPFLKILNTNPPFFSFVFTLLTQVFSWEAYLIT